MRALLRRAVLFFGVFCIFFSSVIVDATLAKDTWKILFQIPIIAASVKHLQRTVSGYVYLNGTGLTDVGIYDGPELVAETNNQGYYKATLPSGLPYTLTAQRAGYQFTPASISIRGNDDDLENQNFSAKKMAIVAISGNVIWKNSGYHVAPPSNPLSLIAVEAYRFIDCYDQDTYSLYARSITDTDGDYSITVPIGWCGYIEPFWEDGVSFFPGKQLFFNIKADQVRNYQTPAIGSDSYTITVSIKKPDGELLPGHNFTVNLDGIKHALGSHYHNGLLTWTGETSISNIAHGWIGTVTPNADDLSLGYSFNPPFIRMNGILSSDRRFEFSATQN